MTKLATVTVGVGGSSAINFTNIPQTYTDLVIKVSARSTDGDWQGMYMRLNSATTNYTSRYLDGTGSAASSGVITTTGLYVSTINGTNSTSSTFTNSEINILNYTSNNNKSISTDGSAENNATAAYLNLIANLFSNTAAVNSISLYSAAGNIAQHSTATLYGVKAARTAVGNSIKAVGGNISFDGTYVVHTFNTSGTFTPSDSLRVDYLVVAGGGAGGAKYRGGGGGAGGMRCTVDGTGGSGSLETPLSLTGGTSYTVTVGAGGAGHDNNVRNPGSNSVFATITSAGGGGGGDYGITTAGQSGGSGGGGGNQSSDEGAGGAASPAGQGFAGGAAVAPNGGGGGGASAAGGTASNSVSGSGGNGRATSISGSSVTYAGGGSGAFYTPQGATGGAAGTGGGGAGSYSSSGGNGVANTGGGGGGSNSSNISGSGGSGVVIVRYRAVV
jgi:hypothetical protein